MLNMKFIYLRGSKKSITNIFEYGGDRGVFMRGCACGTDKALPRVVCAPLIHPGCPISARATRCPPTRAQIRHGVVVGLFFL